MPTKEDILKTANTLAREKVSVPEWSGDGHVFVQEMTGLESCVFRGAIKDAKSEDVTAEMLICCVVNEQGERIFDNGDKAAILSLPARPLKRVLQAAMRINGLLDGEEFAGNSGATGS